MRPVFLVFAALTLSPIASTSTPTAAAAEKNDRPPNIIFIIADDMHRHMFNCLPEGRHRRKNGHWGKAKNLTPAIDRLAAEGTLMLGQHVSAPVCTPSRYSCLTGLYASRSKSPNFVKETEREGQSVVQWTSFITDEQTLPRRLKKAGYTTGLVGKNHVIKGDIEKVGYGEDPNDPKVSERLKIRQQQAEKLIRQGGFDHVSKLYYENPDHNGPRELAVHNMDWTTDGALDFIDHQKDKPFFLYYATTTPHGPGEPNRSWNADPRIIPTGYLKKPLDVLPPRDSIPRRITDAGLRPDSARCNLLWLDDSVAAIMSRLEEHGIDDNTIIVFFNDHGQAAKGTLYQGGVSSPSIIWRKSGFASGSVNNSAVSNIDFAPTLLDFAGVEYEADDFDGRSFAPVLQAKNIQPAGQGSLYFEMGYTRAVTKDGWKYMSLRYPDRAKLMTKQKRHKILDRFNDEQQIRGRPIYTRDPMTPFSHISLIPGGGDAEAMSTGKRPGYYDADQLYDLSADPGEQTNLANNPKHAVKLREMKAELATYLVRLPGDFSELKTASAVTTVSGTTVSGTTVSGTKSTQKPKRPNVLFIAVDDLKPMLGCYGQTYIHSPNIDRLAKRGTVFLNAHCQQAVCAPSRVSLLTGLRPDTTRVYDLKTQFRSILPDVVTLPQHFKNSGYQTLGIGKIYDPRSANGAEKMDAVSWSKPYLQAKSKSDATFGYLNPKTVAEIESLRAKGITGYKDLNAAMTRPPTDAADVPDDAYFDGVQTKRMSGLIGEMSGTDQPYFLAIGFKKPHLPFNAPQKYWDLYDRKKLELSSFQEMPENGVDMHFQPSWELRNYSVPQSGAIPQDLQRELIHGYYACVSYVDAQVGKLLDAVDASGEADNTIIILWGDHGWHLGDHGMFCKHTNFEQATRSPLIVSATGSGQAGKKSSSPVEFIDIFPTLCDLAGVPSPKGLQGTSLRPVMEDPTAMIKPAALSQYPRHYRDGNHAMGYAVRDQRYRYIQWRETDGPPSPTQGKLIAEELYDYKVDPLEKRNVVADPSYVEVVARMKGLMSDMNTGSAAPHVVTSDDLHDYSYHEDEFLVHTNLWGARAMKEDVPAFKFELFRSPVSQRKPPTYRWDISEKFTKPIFPFIGYGDRMWAPKRKSTTARLPIQLKDLESCDLHYKLNIDEEAFREAKGNLAVDVWLGDESMGNDDSMRSEIMLWFDRNDQYPVGGKNHEGTYSFGGATWDLYIGELSDGGTTVNTFIAQQPIYEGTIDFMVPLEIVKAKGRIGETSYLGGFELGNEIYQGRGKTDVEQFHVDVRIKGYPSGNSHQWLFHEEPISKFSINGKKGFDTGVTNDSETKSRTVVARFRVDDLRRRQVIYKEGGANSGLSIYAAAGKVHVAHWNKIDGELKHSLISTPLNPQAESNDKKPDSYVIVVASCDHKNKQLKTIINGKRSGDKPYYGLAANRGTTTLGYSDAAIWYATGMSDNPTTMEGVLDDVVVFDRTLTPDEISSIK